MTTELMEINEQPTSMQEIGSGMGAMVSTVDTSTVEGKNAMLNALNAAVSLADFDNTPIDVCDIIMRPGVRKARDKNQVDTPCVNTYLLSPDGHAYFSQSDGIARSAGVIIDPAMYPDCGRSTDKGCITVMVTSTKLKNGNTIKSLTVL